MKANPLAFALLVLLAVAVQLLAQPVAETVIESVNTPDGSVIKASHYKDTSTNNLEIKAKAENGDPEAQVTLGFNIIESGVLKFDREAAKWVRRTGDTNAAEKATEAAKWFRRAADQGNAFAENNLGACYANGLGVGKDEAEAAKWYRKAAEQDDADAQYSLGRAYETGRGVETNIVEAAKWCDKAAENQNVGAQEWIRKAAMNGDASAQCSLGNLYDDGSIGVEEELKDRPGVTANYHRKNHIEAVKWYRRAAAQGNAAAEFFLGLMYDNGQGVPQDYVEAYKWYNLAAAQGLAEEQGASPAITNRDAIARYMTPDQIAEAQQLSREFKPRKEFGSDNSSSSEEPTATGTGFFITDDGYLISNYHVVKDATKVRLLTGAGLIDAKVVQVDAANDLALLKAEGKFSPLPIAASRAAKLGSTVATVGFPDIGLQGFAPKLAKGEIASLSGARDDPRYFQISVPVQPGNSGGALVDERGNIIGIVSAKLDASAALAESGALPENVNYAVKSSFLLSFLESVPGVEAKLKKPNMDDRKFEEVVKSAQDAAVLVLVY